MRPTALLIAALVGSLAFAGCFGGDDAPTASDDEKLADEAVATEETGSITGQVVATDLEVVANAAVGLTDQNGAAAGETTTDKQGKYTFNGVAPGKYRVQVSAVCCKVGLKELDVVAGDVTEANFQIARLTQDDLRVPYVVEAEWTGFIACGVATPAVKWATCSTLGTDENEDFLLEPVVNKGIQEFVVAMDWKAVGGVSGGEFNLLVENEDCGFTSCTYTYADLEGEPVLRADIDEESISNEDWKWAKIEDNRTLQFRIFAGGQLTLIYQQEFTVYYSAFYYQNAPDDYDPIPDQ